MLISKRDKPYRKHSNRQPHDPYFGYGYNPLWPRIISVACDSTDGGKLYVITDSPCVLLGGGINVPLFVDSFGSPATIWEGWTIAPVKFRFQMSGAMVAGAAWTFDPSRAAGGLGGQLRGTVSGPAPNAGSGTLDDVPGPLGPAFGAAVISATGAGDRCILRFDHPIVRNANSLDESILINNAVPADIQLTDDFTMELFCPGGANPGDAWQIQWQPAWIASIVVTPAEGVLA